jgi:hypothetical protein
VARALTAPDYVQNLDGFLFAAGVERYAMIELRPHFPGYPVYMWLGKLAYAVLGDPRQALRAVSLLASALAVVPIGLLAAALRRASGADEAAVRASAVAAGLVWALAAGPWLVSGEIFSDPLGLLLALVTLLGLWRALEAPDARGLATPAAAAGLMLGARLDYFPLAAPLALAVWRRRGTPAARKAVLAFAACVAVWLSWQLALDRASFATALWRQLTTHVADPGNRVRSAFDLIQRPLGVLRTTWVDGLGGYWPGEPVERWPATLVFATLFGLGLRRLARTQHAATTSLWLWAAAWATWLVLFHDVTFTRYVLPLTAWAAVVASLGLPAGGARWPAVATLAASVGAVGVPLGFAHRTHPPVGEKLARHVERHFEPGRDALILPQADTPIALRYVLERSPDSRVLVVPPEEIAPQAAYLAGEGLAVYGTLPAPAAPERWKPVARFCRDRHLDPRGPFELWLFRLETQAQPAGTPPPACQ